MQHCHERTADGTDQAAQRSQDLRERRDQTALQALADGERCRTQRTLQTAENVQQCAAQAGKLADHISKAAGQAVEDLGAEVPRAIGQLADALAQKTVDLLDQILAEVIDQQLGLRCKTVVQGGKDPLPDAEPVLTLHGFVQRAEGAQHALVGLVLPALYKARKTVGTGLLDGLGHLFGAVGGNVLDPLDHHKGTVHHLIEGLGDHLFGGLGAVGQCFLDGFGAGSNAVYHCVKGRCDRIGHLPHRIHGLLHGLFAIGSNAGNGFDILQHTVHQLTAGLGDGLLLLLLTVGKHLVGGLGSTGDIAQHLGHSVGVRVDNGCSGLCRCARCFPCGGCRIARLGIGRDSDIRHGLGAVGKAGVGGGPVGQFVTAGNIGDGKTGSGCGSDTRHFTLAGQAVDEALDQILAPLHRLRGQALDPCQGAGKTALECSQHGRAHAPDAACHAGEDVLADVQPIHCRNDRKHRLQDLLPVGQQVGHSLYDTHAQLHHQ